MNSRLRNRVTAGAGVLALALALSVLTAALAGAAPSPTQLQRAHDGANVTYVNALPGGGLTQLQRAHAGTAVAYASTSAGGLTQLQRAHAGAPVAYANAGGSLIAATGALRGPLGARAALVGRGRVPARPATTSAGSAGWFVGGLAAAVLLIGSISFLATRSGSRGAEMAPVSSIEQAFSDPARSAEQQSERKAA